VPALHVDLQESQRGEELLARLTLVELHICKQGQEQKSVHSGSSTRDLLDQSSVSISATPHMHTDMRSIFGDKAGKGEAKSKRGARYRGETCQKRLLQVTKNLLWFAGKRDAQPCPIRVMATSLPAVTACFCSLTNGPLPACSALTCFRWAAVLEKVLSQELHCREENLEERWFWAAKTSGWWVRLWYH